jgi:hypothetical protein
MSLFIGVLLLLAACRNSDQDTTGEGTVHESLLNKIRENDTLSLPQLPAGLDAWIRYYQRSDPAFTLGAFRNSGVRLHFGELPDANGKGDTAAFRKYILFSPDHSRYIDLFSYDHFVDKGVMVDGEVDQEVVLADLRSGARKQLMFNTPGRLAEWAAWLNNNQFLIGMTSVSEDGSKMGAQILMFRISDSSYTNFDLVHQLNMDSISFTPKNFSETYFELLERK